MLRPILVCASVIMLNGSCKKSGAGDENGTRADGTGGGGVTQTPEESYAEAFYLVEAGIRAGVAQGMGSPVVLTFDTPLGPKSCVAQKWHEASPIFTLSIKCPFDNNSTAAALTYLVDDKTGAPPRVIRIDVASPQGAQVCDGPNGFKPIDPPTKLASLLPGLREMATAGSPAFINPMTAVSYVAGKDFKFIAPGLEVCSDRKSGFDGAIVTNPTPKDAAFVQAWKGAMEFEGVSRRFQLDTRNLFFYDLFLPSVGARNKTVEDPLIRPAEEGEDNAKRAVEELLARELKTVVIGRASLFPISYPIKSLDPTKPSDQSCFGYGLEIKKLGDGESVGFTLLDGGGKDRPGGKKAFEVRDWKISVSGVVGTPNQKKYMHLPFVVGLFANQLESDSAVSMSPAVRGIPDAVPFALECVNDPSEPACEIMRGAEQPAPPPGLPPTCPKLTLL